MKINTEKSKIMLFNFSKSWDLPPDYSFSNQNILEIVKEDKLLGVTIQSDLKWQSNTNMIYRKAMSRMWLLRRMKILKIDEKTILDYYLKEIRPLAEHAVVVWNSGLTKGQVYQLEKIQKVALYIILEDKKMSYSEACDTFQLKILADRRTDLCTNFALKLARGNYKNEFFTFLPENNRTRSKTKVVKENNPRTSRAENAPHNYLSRLLNQNGEKLEIEQTVFSPHDRLFVKPLTKYKSFKKSNAKYIGLSGKVSQRTPYKALQNRVKFKRA